jgi:hydroxypyruvate isomerase
MPRFAANLTLLYPDLAFPERIAAAARDGFDGVECQFPYAWPAAELAARAAEAGLPWLLINTPAGDWAGGERGLAALPGRETEFRRGIEQALAYADALGCRRLHALAGVPPAPSASAAWRPMARTWPGPRAKPPMPAASC